MLLTTKINTKEYNFEVTPVTNKNLDLFFLIQIAGGETFLAERTQGIGRWGHITAKLTPERLSTAILKKIERASIYMTMEKILTLPERLFISAK